MPADFSDHEILAYLDEALPVAKMVAVEAEMRVSQELRARAAALGQRRDATGHSVGEIWRRGRLSCPSRHQLGSYLLGAVPEGVTRYIAFHVDTIGCRYCNANLEDLRQAAQPSAARQARRQKFFQSSAGYVRPMDREE